METTRPGSRGLGVSRLCLGTMSFGPETAWLDRVWPGPGGEAPEAYAW